MSETRYVAITKDGDNYTVDTNATLPITPATLYAWTSIEGGEGLFIYTGTPTPVPGEDYGYWMSDNNYQLQPQEITAFEGEVMVVGGASYYRYPDGDTAL